MSHKKIFLIAGEASGDQLGARLMQALKSSSQQPIDFQGIGGPMMAEQGLSSLFPMSDLSVMGFAEVVPHLPKIMRRIKQAVASIEASQPSVIITIDSPGFTFRVVKALRRRKRVTCPMIHYVAPTVWAYKPERAAKTARLFDHLMVLLPFEPPFFEKEGLPTTFTGHPVLDDLDVCFRKRAKAQSLHAGQQVTLCLMAGSRVGEITRLLPIYRKALELIAPKYPNLQIRIAGTPQTEALLLKLATGWPWPGDLVIGMEGRYEAFYESDLALCKSGTVTLEAAKTGLPMVVTYKVNPLSAWIVGRLLKTKMFTLINILRGEMIIPEFIQKNCTPALIAQEVLRLLESHHAREKQKHDAYAMMQQMKAPDGRSASESAAGVVWAVMDGRTP
ncbi:MAG: lipid-A-disaccharide synthase [Rickettsiales bacterium]|nr:lipid-A-disaccharide synthase [Rickettsiales bacterium]